MLSHFTLIRIAKLIQATADAETQIEIVRQVLCEKPAFETFTAFKRISKFHSKITAESLFSFLSDNNSNITKDDAYYLVRLFDTDRDRRLSFTEFLEIVLPKTNPRLKERVNSRKIYNSEEDEGLPYQVEHALVRIFEEELQYYKNCESIRQELAVSRDFSIMNAFGEIDVKNRGFFEAEDLLAFFEKINKSLGESQVQAFMQRIDKDSDGKVTFADFLEIFYSKEIDLLKKDNKSTMTMSATSSSTINIKMVDTAAKPVTRGREQESFGESSGSDKYLDRLREMYASPTRRNMSPSKKQFMGSGENFFSPGSTNASSKYNAASDKEVDAKQTAHKVRFAEQEQMESSNRKRQSPMKVKDELELVKAFEEMVGFMNSLEDVKNEMAARKDFNLYNAFAVLDADRKGSIDKKQLSKGLQKIGLRLTKGELYLMMKRFDTQNTGVIKFGDFSYVSTPKSKEFAKLLSSKLAYYATHYGDPLKIFATETIDAIRAFWSTLIKEEMLCETIRQRLSENKTFKLQDAFKTLDTRDAGFVTASQLGNFLAKYGVCLSKEEINGLVERLTISDNKKVSYVDFVNTMTPRSPEKYSR